MSKKEFSFASLILAGGQSRRMGGQDKAYLDFQGLSMLEAMLGKVPPHSSKTYISCQPKHLANENFGLTLVHDDPKFIKYGPLAGILAGLEAIEQQHLLVLPCDTPMLRNETVEQLISHHAMHTARISVLSCLDQIQPLHVVLDKSLKHELRTALENGERKVRSWLEQHHPSVLVITQFPEQFSNMNTPSDLFMGGLIHEIPSLSD